MSGAEAGAGVPVVLGRAGGGFRLDAAALRGVLAGAGPALPTAVLSVAGATRGGKSFLLDFCLRYLRATPSARSDGSWLGAEDEPLEGFSWRGGCERNTIGIHIWSEPFVLTRQNGEQVVVLLMDTQGTFDSSSTIQESTTIFAMSTLLSSLQIFNISGNIQEDHLQYLQFFTEYGKLAKEECSTPFQDLLFLVRDWSYAYQHPLGAAGGQQLLEKRLQIDENQAEELREVRQHIKACFESLRGFLMPHPGLIVATSPQFKGCLSDVSKEFRDALLELIPALFEDNLTLKKVNGQEIQVHELMEYFESYMEMFNSEMMPTPVSILKATSEACLQAARGGARALYEQQMCGGGGGEGGGEGGTEAGGSCPRGALLRRHAAATDAARAHFLQRRTLAPPDRAAELLDLLMQELNGQFATYAALNEANTQTTINASKELYTKRMLHMTECLLPNELEEKHRETMEEAIALFDRSRLMEPNDDGAEQEDEDRDNLQKELNNFLNLRDEIEGNNEANINAASVTALQRYQEEICQNQSVLRLCVLPDHLTALHSTAKEVAEQLFRLQWKSQGSVLDEPVAALLDKINDRLRELQSFNTINNDNAVAAALKFYENNMKYEILSDGCLHPLDLLKEHEKLYKSTMAVFYRSRTYGDTWNGRDNQKLRLIREVTKSHANFIKLNDRTNKDAVKTAHNFYEVGMQITRSADALPEFVGTPDFDLFERHKLMRPRAIIKFQDLRRLGPIHAEDEYLDELNGLIDSSYRWLILKFISMGVISIGTFFLLRRFWM